MSAQLWLAPPPAWVQVDKFDRRAAAHRKRDPGRCFIKAGWRVVELRAASHGRPELVILEAP